MFRHVIWDFDGTLFDTYPFFMSALSRALERRGIAADARVMMAKFMDCERAALDYYCMRHGLGEDFRRDYFAIKAAENLSLIRQFPGAEAACRGVISAGGRNYILTHRDGSALGIVEMCGMGGLFCEIVTSDSGFPRKPDPAGAMYLMAKHSMRPDETLIVGDRELEVQLARNAGVRSCFFANGDARCVTPPDYTVRELAAVIDIVRGSV